MHANVFTLLSKMNIYIIRYLLPIDNRDPKGCHQNVYYLSCNSLDIVLFLSSLLMHQSMCHKYQCLRIERTTIANLLPTQCSVIILQGC